jgi:hypothetical protein
MVSFFITKKQSFVAYSPIIRCLIFILYSMENDNNFGYEKITIVVDNIPLRHMETIGYIRDLRVIKHNRDL